MGLALAEQTRPQLKVLLIDDDLDQHSLIGRALKNDYAVSYEASGANAVNMALQEKPDLILLDLQMPNVDGFEVLEQLKRHPLLSSIPIFCLSASADEATRIRCTNGGASGFFNKPVNIKTLALDVSKTLKNLSNVLFSEDRRNSVLIGLNEAELIERFHDVVAKETSRGKKIVCISIREGIFFSDEMIDEQVNRNEVIYLQIKPSLITRLPFIDDLNIVMSDLQKLLDAPSKEYSLIVERPELLLLSPSNDNKTATILAFSESMNKNFSEVHYLCKKPTTAFELPVITEMSRLLARQF